jgi:hypothetical protein
MQPTPSKSTFLVRFGWKIMKRALFISGMIGFFYLVLINLAVPGSPPQAAPKVSSDALLAARPVYGWRVCADLGVGLVPGLGIYRQRFRLCQGEGWVSLAYCTQTNQTPPPVNTLCSFVNASDVWCGDNYQILREYSVVATAAPSPTRTFTPTFTFTPSATRTFTATNTATFTNTPTASYTPTRTRTPAVNQTVTVAPSRSRTPGRLNTGSPSITPGAGGGNNQRVRPGGPGNLEWYLVSGFSILTWLAAGILAWRAVRTLRAQYNPAARYGHEEDRD